VKIKSIKGSLRWSGQTRGGSWLTMELGAEADLSPREKVDTAFARLGQLLREQLNERWRESNRHGAPAPKVDGQGAGEPEGLVETQTSGPNGSRGATRSQVKAEGVGYE